MSQGEPVLVDVDVALKVCTYRLVAEFVECASLAKAPAILAISRFTLRSRLRTARYVKTLECARKAVESLIASVTLIEPTEEEIELAGDFEEKAIKNSLEFDTGESQLLAVLLRRGGPLLITGDKRAIQAIHDLATSGVGGRVACLEQLLATILARYGHEYLRRHICQEPNADRAATICFACSTPQVKEEDIRTSLASYVNHLRSSTASLLLASSDLSAVVP